MLMISVFNDEKGKWYWIVCPFAPEDGDRVSHPLHWSTAEEAFANAMMTVEAMKRGMQ